MKTTLRAAISVAILAVALGIGPAAVAGTTATDWFHNVWARSDQPVSTGTVARTWLWGPAPDSAILDEPYAESPNGERQVQYFDKGRMEITHPNDDASSEWYVTSGLLTKEMVTGEIQTGDRSFQPKHPATINVAGDLNDPSAPTYATFGKLLGYGATPNGWTAIQTVDRSGVVGADPTLARFDVSAMDVGATTGHTVASVFWDDMNASGTIWNGTSYVQGPLEPNPFFATGLPITEPYWTLVKVAGAPTNVLVQLFERRVLTYTPSNPAGWQVESGNDGQHYYQWRYGGHSPVPPTGTPPSTPPSGSAVPAFDHVYVIMMENKEYGSVVGDPAAPYLNQLIAQHGLATNYDGVSHPSEPNYVALWSGATQGVDDDGTYNLTAPTVADQLEAAGVSWKVYAENYPVSQACFTGSSASGGEDGSGDYARKHNPAISFTSVSGNPTRCSQHLTDFTHFTPSAAQFNLIVPNLCHDMHDCSVATGDSWLSSWLGSHILNTSTWSQTNSAVIITWDEGESGTGGGGHIPTIIISKQTPAGFTSGTAANHYTLLHTIQESFGVGCLQQSCSAGDLRQFFGGP